MKKILAIMVFGVQFSSAMKNNNQDSNQKTLQLLFQSAYNQQNYKAALKFTQKMTTIPPEYYFAVAYCYAFHENSDNEEKIKELNKAVEYYQKDTIYPEDKKLRNIGNCFYFIGCCYKGNNEEKAQKYYKESADFGVKSLEKSPEENKKLLSTIYARYRKAKKFDLSVEYAFKYYESSKDLETLSDISQIFAEAGNEFLIKNQQLFSKFESIISGLSKNKRKEIPDQVWNKLMTGYYVLKNDKKVLEYFNLIGNKKSIHYEIIFYLHLQNGKYQECITFGKKYKEKIEKKIDYFLLCTLRIVI